MLPPPSSLNKVYLATLVCRLRSLPSHDCHPGVTLSPMQRAGGYYLLDGTTQRAVDPQGKVGPAPAPHLSCTPRPQAHRDAEQLTGSALLPVSSRTRRSRLKSCCWQRSVVSFRILLVKGSPYFVPLARGFKKDSPCSPLLPLSLLQQILSRTQIWARAHTGFAVAVCVSSGHTSASVGRQWGEAELAVSDARCEIPTLSSQNEGSEAHSRAVASLTPLNEWVNPSAALSAHGSVSSCSERVQISDRGSVQKASLHH